MSIPLVYLTERQTPSEYVISSLAEAHSLIQWQTHPEHQIDVIESSTENDTQERTG